MGEPHGREMEIQLGEGWDEEETKKGAPLFWSEIQLWVPECI